MRATDIFQGLSCLSLKTAILAVRRPSLLRHYISCCMKKYDELTETGLPCRLPPTPPPDTTIALPGYDAGGGMNYRELAILAQVTIALGPDTIFEIGTYHGLTTAVFLLNSNPDTEVISLDLPTESDRTRETLAEDQHLINTRNLGSVPRALCLRAYTQLLCDSMSFDPTPYLSKVDLALVDGAHDLAHVQNDTIKVIRMMSNRGIIFWHDYGGRSELGPLTSYLESLGCRCPVYRIPDTNFAWAEAAEVQKLL